MLHWFVDAGAPESILWQAHPHVGSDNLARIVSAIREDIIRLGGEVRFHTKLVEMKLEDGQLTSITLRNIQTGEETLQPCTALVLACGHSARDTFELVRDAGFAMEQKPFSMGVRIEHPQALINEAQWGSAATHPALGAAEYKLAIHLPSGRSVYSFCMCPGGEVVAAASEAGGIVTNGMSNYARDGKNANAALLVNVDPADLASSDVLAGVELQRAVEQRAYRVAQEQGGAPYQAPAQTVGAFLGKEHAFGGDTVHCDPTYERGVVEAPLDEVLPDFRSWGRRSAASTTQARSLPRPRRVPLHQCASAATNRFRLIARARQRRAQVQRRGSIRAEKGQGLRVASCLPRSMASRWQRRLRVHMRKHQQQ